MKIVDLLSSDIDKILALYENNFADGWNKNMLESAFNSGRFISLGIEEDEKLIGIISCSTTEFDADIEGITIDEDFRRNGFAKALLGLLEVKLKEKNIEKVFLEVRLSNTPAKNLYLGAGYKEISIRKKYYSDGEDAVIMAKEL
ncbi:MAG: ribosomal protein S18-alanine N-acetyltransferase [Clostridia bacterium]|nr:ribosomal protein S18-alanine N-acetyltransferase [Clostridia bacterium]